jgi:hypothetical protein
VVEGTRKSMLTEGEDMLDVVWERRRRGKVLQSLEKIHIWVLPTFFKATRSENVGPELLRGKGTQLVQRIQEHVAPKERREIMEKTGLELIVEVGMDEHRWIWDSS